jgi:MoxR-like ATPase
VIAQIVLADEINRATPKTQSSLLEAMEERQITVDGETHPLPQPFMVIATQNPIEYEGTFPLPESQLDRFLLRIHLGYPSRTQEVTVLESQQLRHPIDSLSRVVSDRELLEVQAAVRAIHADRLIKQYVVDISSATRDHPDVYLGASPRGSLSLFRATQARAVLPGRDFVIPDDVKALAVATLAHRVIVSPAARVKNVSARTVVDEVLQSLPVPGSRIPAG